jgi:putative membrane protein
MLIEIILFVFLGILAGTFTGLIPGIHINLVAAFLVSSSAILLKVNAIYLAVFIISLSITHTFLDFIPSVLLGCPDTDTELSILPGHKMLKDGLAYEAIMLTCYGSLAAIFVLMVILAPAIFIVPKIYSLLEGFIPYLLILVSLTLVFSESGKFRALLVFVLTGLLGFFVLNLEADSSVYLLPLLSGLFGSSSLIISIKSKTQIPKQEIKNVQGFSLKPVLSASLVAPICSFLPGLGSGQAAVIGSKLVKSDEKSFLVLLGATNTIVMGFSFVSLYLISKTRTGSAAAIGDIIGTFSLNYLIFFMLIVLISGIISFFLTKILSVFLVEKFEKINYQKTTIAILVFLSAVVFLISGFLGFLILIVSTIAGIYCINQEVRRTNMMGCLIIPTILFYFGF